MNSTQPRIPAGSPEGGQFAASAGAESGGGLDPDSIDQSEARENAVRYWFVDLPQCEGAEVLVRSASADKFVRAVTTNTPTRGVMVNGEHVHVSHVSDWVPQGYPDTDDGLKAGQLVEAEVARRKITRDLIPYVREEVRSVSPTMPMQFASVWWKGDTDQPAVAMVVGGSNHDAATVTVTVLDRGVPAHMFAGATDGTAADTARQVMLQRGRELNELARLELRLRHLERTIGECRWWFDHA